ncbi:MAG: hypothetical protein ACYCYN_03015 [Solirubrobacteraceae bacterium]
MLRRLLTRTKFTRYAADDVLPSPIRPWQGRAGVLATDSEAAALIGAEEIPHLNEGRLLGDPPGREGEGEGVYQLPTRRAAADG